MDFSKGYTASFYGVYLDPVSKSELDRFEILSGSINREETDIRHSANLTIKDYVGMNDQWIRVYMVAKQGSDSERVALFTGIASSPSYAYNNGVTTTNVQCYSCLKAISDVLMPIGWYAGAGTNGSDQLYKLLERVPFPVYIEGGTPNLSYSVIAESGETYLSMVDAILSAMAYDGGYGWKLQIEGNGSIYISPYSNSSVATFSCDNENVIETSFNIERDWFECPNVFRVRYGNYIAIARDDDPESDLSTLSRGREIWMEEESANLMDNESIGEYAQRRLNETQSKSEKISYTRRFLPEVNQGDLVRISYPEINGDYYVESQSITLGINAKVSETVYREL